MYGLLQTTFLFFSFIIGLEGIAFVLQVLVFSTFTVFIAPQFLRIYYQLDFWQIIRMNRKSWTISVVFSVIASFAFISSAQFTIGKILFFKSGLGKLSYGSIVFAPIYEELLFRGILLGLSNRVFSEINSIRMNAGMFGIWHFGVVLYYGFSILVPILIFGTMIFAYLLSYIQLKFNRLWIPIILHAIANIILALLGVF